MIWTGGDGAFRGVPARARVVAGNACGTPLTLLAALADHAEHLGDVTLTSGLLLGDPPLAPGIRSGALRVQSWHVYGAERRLYREGLVEYLPIRLLDVPHTVLRGADVALVRVGPPDSDGLCSLGPSTSFAAEAIEEAALVVAEVSPDVPRTRGASTVHVSRIDRFVRSQTPMAEYVPATPDPVSLAVARNVLEVLPDGATVQLGIGAVGEGLAAELARVAGARSFGLLGIA